MDLFLASLFYFIDLSAVFFQSILFCLIELCNTVWNQGRWCFQLCSSFSILHWLFCSSTQILKFFLFFAIGITLSFYPFYRYWLYVSPLHGNYILTYTSKREKMGPKSFKKIVAEIQHLSEYINLQIQTYLSYSPI